MWGNKPHYTKEKPQKDYGLIICIIFFLALGLLFAYFYPKKKKNDYINSDTDTLPQYCSTIISSQYLHK